MERREPAESFVFEGFSLDRHGLFRLDPAGRAEPVMIGSRALGLLLLLARRSGDVVSKDEIMETVWPGVTVEESNLTVQVSALRRALSQNAGKPSYIQTIPGRGYRFTAMVRRLEKSVAVSPCVAIPDKSIVVLPFQNISGDSQQEVFSDGLVENITAVLCRVLDLFVNTGNCAFAYKRRAVPVQQVSRELGVRYVIEGTVRTVGNRIRVIAELIDGHSGKQVWAERYEGPTTDIFGLEDRIAESVVGAIQNSVCLGGIDRHAIAVLPFANLSGDQQQEYFADGLTEDLIAMLASWQVFPVIARASTFAYKGKTVDIKRVGQELGVRYVLEGSVRKSGHRIRVTAQLVDADTGHHIMAERYDRDLTGLFELQDEIVTAIAGAIEPELLKSERNRIAERPLHSEDAYELYQHGVWHQHRYTRDDHREAQRLFRAALAIDPDYPQAAAALAQVLCNAGFLNWSDDPERCYEEALELAERAVALEPRYPHAHFVLGLACVWTSRCERAISALQDAIKLNPSFAAAYILLGQTFIYQGEPEKAVRLIEKAIRFSPTDPRMFVSLTALAGAHYQLCQYEQAVEVGHRAWAINRNWPGGFRYMIAGLAQLGRTAEAQAMLPELKRLNRDLAFVEANLNRLYSPGNRAGVVHILDGLRKAGFE